MRFVCLLLLVAFFGCAKENTTSTELPDNWEQLLTQARGQSPTWMMWQGDPLINAYVADYVIPAVKEKYDINLQVVDGQGTAIVSSLMTELEAGKASSELDMVWINGETFFQLRQIDGLYGPFVDRLPNSRYINLDNPFIGIDFQQPVNGYECPWGNVQMALIYNTDQVSNPPQTMEELEAWVKAHPGKFTLSNDFTGMTLLKSWLIELGGGMDAFRGDFDAQRYEQASAKLWAYVNRLKPYLWNKGESFPNATAAMHQLFANGEIYFTMSNNDAEVDNKIRQGVFAENSRAYVPETGTIQNSHYLGIVKNAPNKAAALVVINFLISPEAQYKKMQPDVWGDGTILSVKELPDDWPDKFAAVPGRTHAPARDSIQRKALMEPAPEYMIRLYDDFRTQVLEK